MKNLSTRAEDKTLAILLILLLFIISVSCEEQQVTHDITIHPQHKFVMKKAAETREGAAGLGMKLYPMGSNLPDCSHACGPCAPCKRVIVSFKCSIESCPVVYRCVCKGKYYHVPSP